MNRLITYSQQLFWTIEQVSDCNLVRQYSAYNSQNIESRSVEYALLFDNGYLAVCNNRNLDLYSHRILSVTPKGRNPEMLLYPSEEQSHLPFLLVQQGDNTGFEHKIFGQAKRQSRAICQEGKCPLQFRSVVNYPPEITRIFLLGLIARKAYRLVKQNIIRLIKQVLTINILIVEMRLLSVISVSIGVGNIAEFDVSATKSEMETLVLDGINNADGFSEALATG